MRFIASRKRVTSPFVQAPIYQRINGLQLEARWFGSLGLHYIF